MKRKAKKIVILLGFVAMILAGMGFSQHQEEGEEPGERLSLNETYDQVRNGVRLTIAFHNASSSFVGAVENVTEETIKAVRVEVHLSYGKGLGPTKPLDLAPGEKVGIKLEAPKSDFTWWTVHAETGSGEHEHHSEEEEEHAEKEHAEESAQGLSLTDVYDRVHDGVRLTLAFHKASDSFIGSVQNVTDKAIKSVRVEVHLSNGTKLSLTKPMNLAPEEKASIKIEARGSSFTWWKVYLKSGSDE